MSKMNLGFYDIDLFHSSGAKKPNFQLMKVYNYHYQANELVTMCSPADTDLGRFTHLLYFKDNINNNYGKNNLKDPTKKIITFGYGFYKQEIPLVSKYSDVPPSLVPYDKFYEKFNSTLYEKMKQSSFIHFCMRDFTGFNKNYKHIYIVDHNVAQDTEIGDFFHEYHNYSFHFYHTPTCNSIEEYERVEKFENLFQCAIKINFKYNKDFILQYRNKPFYPIKMDNETEEESIIRLLKTILILKSQKIKISLPPYSANKLVQKILTYAYKAPPDQSCFEYYKNDNIAEKLIQQQPSEIRLLLKTNPKNGIIDL